MTTGRLESINTSRGGVPKMSMFEALVTEHGVDGDRQRDLRFHGGPDRAGGLLRMGDRVTLAWSARRIAEAAVVLAAMLGNAACTRTASSAPKMLTVASKAYTVTGEYAAVALDRVDGLKVERGRLVVKGLPKDVEVDVPASADLERAAHHWALVTDAHVDGHRLLVFTEAESVTDVSIELPDGEAPIHFDVFAARGGGEILAFAAGDRQLGPPSLYGQVTIRGR